MPTPRKDEKKADFVSRCMGNAEAKKDFPDQDQRLAFCHSVWEDSRNQLTVLAAIQSDAQPRTEVLMGREFLVIDAVLVQGQVLNNNLGPTLLPPADITEDWAKEWNGAPVIIHDHPTNRGVAVSARTPEILDARGVGMVFHAEVDKDAGGTARLKAEVWLETARAEQVAELAGILNRLQTGGKVELSTGFPVMAIDGIGTFNGRQYEKIMHPKGVDHLAIFADKVGACSVGDGCGLGVHTEQEESDAVDVNDKEERGLILRALAHLLPKAAGNAEENAPTATPATPCEQKTGTEFRLLIRRLKAQGLNNTEIGAACGRCPTTIGQVERGLILHPAEDALEKLKEYARQKFLSASKLVLQAEGDRSDEEQRKMLDAALESAFGGANKFLWIDATYAEQKRVVFGLVKDTPAGANEQLFEVTYELATDSQEITFSDEPKEVKRRVVYEPVANAAANKEGQMADKDKAAADKAAEEKAAADKAAEEKAAEEKAAENKAAEEKAAEEKAAEEKAAEEKAAADKAAEGKDAQNTEIQELRDTVKSQATAIEELKKITAPVVAENERERQAMVKELAENKAVPFDEAELQAKPVDELRKLHAMSRGENYAGRGGPRVAENTASSGQQQFAPTVPYFGKKPKEKKEGEE